MLMDSIAESRYPTTYVVGLIVGVVLFVPSLLIAHAHQLTGWQASLFHTLNNWPDVFRLPALWITEGLGAAYPIILCVLIPLLYKRLRLAWLFLVNVGATGVVMEIAKMIAKEPRPAALLHGNLHLRANEAGLTSFPSGHEAVATAMALTLWFILPKGWRWLAVLWIAIMAVSRVYLGVHQPIDIIGGLSIGLAVVCFVRLLPKAITKRLHLYHDKESLLARS